jgi:hypothetical protein
MHGPETARRLYAHELIRSVIENIAAMEETGTRESQPSEYAYSVGLRNNLEAEYGPTFGAAHYGWAAVIVGRPKPTFEQIEDAAGMSGWRKAYVNVSPHVHATSRPLYDELFRRHGTDPDRPTWNGLASPAIMTIRSLLQATMSLLTDRCRTPDAWAAELASAAALDAIAREAMDAFASHEWPWWGLRHHPKTAPRLVPEPDEE